MLFALSHVTVPPNLFPENIRTQQLCVAVRGKPGLVALPLQCHQQTEAIGNQFQFQERQGYLVWRQKHRQELAVHYHGWRFPLSVTAMAEWCRLSWNACWTVPLSARSLSPATFLRPTVSNREKELRFLKTGSRLGLAPITIKRSNPAGNHFSASSIPISKSPKILFQHCWRHFNGTDWRLSHQGS